MTVLKLLHKSKNRYNNEIDDYYNDKINSLEPFAYWNDRTWHF